ncbi:polyhydroxyalkanoate synthesis repressor PhaR [Sphingorhabdus lutea]|uniref:Polyhydroxyalkanoate synthesis repressor PhaR n=1 Tax=Sphingorhabdus lutea TaxID=1913578 RepID=A0A1L3JC07_9SPHN|nr:polyhydroxyalkanoate synthesis repressor PhaR [Sphingorhabdus lutea]APG62674.1 polyhydroxyalkanoate synthesis repressor PhaR [Sphingorhabdus lutea]
MKSGGKNNSGGANASTPIIIKKYANRRLYNTQNSKYITLDFLAELIRDNVEFTVIDAKTKEDITHHVLTQIIMEEETNGENLLPVGFLRDIISMYGKNMQAMVPSFLENSMQNFRKNQKQFQDIVETAITSGPFGDIAKKNIEMARSAKEMLLGGFVSTGQEASKSADKNAKDDEVAKLKKQIEEMQNKIDEIQNK